MLFEALKYAQTDNINAIAENNNPVRY